MNNVSADISRSQITKIHIAKSELGLTDQQYRDTLSGFVSKFGQPCSSCKELNTKQADALLNIFKRLGWKEKRRGKILKYEEFANRDSNFADPKQMRRIDALWHTSHKVRERTDEAMNRFIKRIVGVDHIGFVLKKDVHKIIKAIQQL
ncbi:MAG: regulatory protein GemA [Ignavibacteriales bacterium]|nr:regulatory protein GemA [Ignavibacteriales bacterium]